MPDDPIRELLETMHTVAVVGASPKPSRDSHRIAAYLQQAGYRIVPVNPGYHEILGERCYPDLESIPAAITLDVVNVFLRPEHVPPVAEATIARGVPVLWLQLGVSNPEAEQRAAAAGVWVISNRCIKVEHAMRIGTRSR